jgi:hypothetical protein
MEHGCGKLFFAADLDGHRSGCALDCLPRMATQTRSFPTMSNEPSDPDAAPRRRGFVRRNWGVLVFAASALLISALDAHVDISPRMFLSIREGNIGWTDHRTSVVCYLESLQPETGVRWKAPQFGGRIRFGGRFASVPMWLLLMMAVTWIAFREWQRKRATKGKACPG